MSQQQMTLDDALFSSVDKVINYYESVITAMAKTHATQERATLNEDDLKNIARTVVVRCWNHLGRFNDIRSFDGLVKDAIKKRLLSEQGKEFCRKRGRFLFDHYQEMASLTDERDRPTDHRAFTAVCGYHDMMHTEFNYNELVEDLYGLLPDDLTRRVFTALLQNDFGFSASKRQQARCAKQLAKEIGLTEIAFMQVTDTIQFIVSGYRSELFDARYRTF